MKEVRRTSDGTKIDEAILLDPRYFEKLKNPSEAVQLEAVRQESRLNPASWVVKKVDFIILLV